ncbi:MAG: DUF3108 domain-containing protein [Burkholderiaceae bacterium]|nr:DUF3108 domain-containing protein [Burkholderiaceae bacterium]
MTLRRSRLPAGAAVFVLLSVAMHAGLWNVARRVSSSLPVEPAESVAVRLVAAAPLLPLEAAARSTVRQAADSARPARSRPAAPAPKRRVRPTAVAASAPAELRAATPDPAAWRHPVVLPEFDDSIDEELVFASASRGDPEAPAGRSGGHAAQAQGDEIAMAAMPAMPVEDTQAASPTPLNVVPASGSVHYRVHYGDPSDGNVVAMLEQRFEIDDRRYRLHSEGRATGVVSWFYRGTLMQESSGRVSTAGLQPERYRERRGERGEKVVVLDTDAARVHFASGAEAALPRGAQDRLSVFVQLGLLLRADPVRFAPGAVVELPVLSNSRVEATTFRVLGNETLATGDVDVAALHLRRDPLDDDDPTIDLWLAREPRLLPLRVRITEASGRALDQVVVLDHGR